MMSMEAKTGIMLKFNNLNLKNHQKSNLMVISLMKMPLNRKKV